MEQLLINNSWPLTIAIYLIGAIILAAVVVKRQSILKFSGEVRTELAKCTWPWDKDQTGLRKYKPLIETTVMIIICTIMLAGYIAFFDLLINKFVRLLVSF
ncbi:MAG: preprotein translocase subunit SecE [Verrucomicrobiota bacterium]